MVHDLNIFHVKHFGSFLDRILAIFTKSGVQFNKIIVVSVEPLPFPTVDFHDFAISSSIFFFSESIWS